MQNDIDVFFNSLKNTKKDVIKEKSGYTNIIGTYKLFYDLKTNKIDRKKLYDALNNAQNFKKIVVVFEDFLNSMSDEGNKAIASCFNLDSIDAEDLAYGIKNTLLSSYQCVLSSKNKIMIDETLNEILDAISKRIKSLIIRIDNFDMFISIIDKVLNNYSKNRNKMIYIDIKDILSLNTFKEVYTNYEKAIDELYTNIKLYNNEHKIRYYFNTLTKTKLDNLSYDMFPKKEDNLDMIYPLLKKELEDYVISKNKCEYILPLLDMWYYVDHKNYSKKMINNN